MIFGNVNIGVISAANLVDCGKSTFGEITNLVVLVFPVCLNG